MHTETGGHPGGDPTIQVELSVLAADQLLGAENSSDQVVPVGAIIDGAGNIPANVGYGRLALLSGGETIVRLAQLAETVTDDERAAWLDALRVNRIGAACRGTRLRHPVTSRGSASPPVRQRDQAQRPEGRRAVRGSGCARSSARTIRRSRRGGSTSPATHDANAARRRQPGRRR